MKKMRWKPDTCSCEFMLLVDYDETLKCELVVGACKAHNTGTPDEIFQKAHKENVYKNKCVAEVCKDHNVQPGEVDWKFDKEFNLTLAHKDVDTNVIKASVNKISK